MPDTSHQFEKEFSSPRDGTGLWACLHARDANRMIDFLVNGLGFVAEVVVGDDSVIHHAELLWPHGGGLMMGSAKDVHEPGKFALAPGTFGCYLVTDDADGLFNRSLDAGAIAINEPHETDFGSRQAVVQDFEGNQWSFGTYLGARHGK